MDLAEQIDDFIPSVQTGRSDMDSLIMLVFVTSTATLLLAFLGRLAYQKFVAYRLSSTAEPVTSATTLKTSPTTTATAVPATLNAPATASSPNKPLIQRPSPATNTQSAATRASPFTNRPTTRDAMKSTPASKSRSLSQSSLTSAGGVRKRLSRASPGPDMTRSRTPKKTVTSPENISGVDDTIVAWINKVFKWLYSDLVIVNDVLFGFITAVNQTMGRNSEENEIIVEIVRILPESTVPNISNVFCDKSIKGSASEVVVSMDVETTLIVQLKAFQQKAGKTEVLHYRANIRIKGHASTHMNFGSLIGEMRLEGFPDVKITIASIGTIKTLGNDDKQIQNTIIEILNLSIRDSLYPVDFSMHATCPRAMKMEPDNIYDNRGGMSFPSPYDMMTMNNYQSPGMGMNNGGNNFSRFSASNLMQQQQMVQANRRLLVKIVKGEGLTHANDPYVSVEMDEPPQKNQTGARQGHEPLWDEHFLFDLSHASSEILFEVYDRPDQSGYPKFLGLGLVGIDELSVGVASSQIIALQPRPYETDDVSGAITVEFVFIEGAQIPTGRRPYKLKEALKINGNNQFEPHDARQQQFYDPSHDISQDQWHQQVDEEKNKNHQSLSSPRTTSSSRTESNTLRPINYSSPNHIVASTNGDARDVLQDNKSHLSPPPRALKQHPTQPSTLNMKISMIQKENSAEPQPSPSVDDFSENRGRDKKRSSIFGTLKKRLSRSRTRKEDQNDSSILNGNNSTSSAGRPTSSSAEVAHNTNNNKYGGPFSRLGLPISRKSSFSEASAISNSSRMSSVSNKTFLHEASTLVLEVIENGVTRHYLVPMNVAQKPRWRRKGVKMHIYNDHTFIAKHLTSGLICEICLHAIPFRIGKQGYECRDCLLKCHKQCHVRTNQLCPKPTIQSIELCNLTDSQS